MFFKLVLNKAYRLTVTNNADLQKLALRLQGEGKPYKRPPEKKRKLQAGLDSKPRLAGKMTERGGLDQEETGSRPSQVVQVTL